jgi:nitrogen fixation/metabolism regulation signal transduction histidine kinase
MATKTVKKTNKKPATTNRVPHLYKERNPECNKITGKFVWLYVIFALTTLAFAAISVSMFFAYSELFQKYEKIPADCRAGNCQVVRPEVGGDDIVEE